MSIRILKDSLHNLEYYRDNNIQVAFGILEDECSNVLQNFFKTLRVRD